MSEARETADLYPSVVEGISGTGNFFRKGTWTPILSELNATDTTASTHSAVQTALGWYERIGDTVFVNWRYTTPATSYSYTNGSNGTGQLTFVGLPFTVANETSYYPVATCGYFATWSSWSAGYTPMGISTYGQNRVRCYYAVADGVQNLPSSHHSGFGSDSIWSMTYRTDDA